MLRSRLFALCTTAAALAATAAPAAHADTADAAYALSNGRLVSFDPHAPASTLTSDSIDGVAAGDSLVALTVRPQNGVLYALGVNAAADTGTFYVIGIDGNSHFAWPATATPVGTVGSIALTTDGTTPVDLPAGGYGLSFNPAVDRARVTTTSGLNFRVDPNTGAPIDGNNGGAVTTGINPDGALHGASTTAGGIGYTGAHLNATATTAYTLDATDDELALLNPANAGNQTGALPLTDAGVPFDVGSVAGFAIDPDVRTTTSNAPVTPWDDWGYAALRVGPTTKLYRIALATGEVTQLGTIGDGRQAIQGLALPRSAEVAGYPAIGLDADGSNTLRRFQSARPGTQTTVAVTGLNAGEQLQGVSWRTQTGQLIGVGIDAAADTGSVYRIDPQTGAATAFGTPGSLAWVDGSGRPVDLPASGWGVDVEPTYDTVRLINGPVALNLRASFASGAAIDGDLGGAAGSVPGTNPYHPLTGTPVGSTGPTAITYAYNWPHVPLGSSMDVAHVLEPGTDRVLLVLGSNQGQLLSNGDHPLVADGRALDFGPVTATDYPLGMSGAYEVKSLISALVVGGVSGLYAVNPENGATDALGTLPSTLRAIAVGAAEPAVDHGTPICQCSPPTVDDNNNDNDKNTNEAPRTYVAPLRPQTLTQTAPQRDVIAPTIQGVRVAAKVKRRLTVSFTASEAGKATIKLTRTVRHGRRTVRKTYRSVSRTINKAGRVAVTFRGLKAGLRLRVEVTMKDTAGNAARAVAKSATVRGR